MKDSFAALVFCGLLIAASSMAGAGDRPPETAPTTWKLTFYDEFGTFDHSRWDTTFPSGLRHLGNGEKELFVDPKYSADTLIELHLNPFTVADGIMTIEANRAPAAVQRYLEGRQYTSGMLSTFHSFSQTYGYFVMRAKLPAGKGFWPAFWLLPTNQSWPPEIDVMEVLGYDPTTLYATIHMGSKDNPLKTGFGIRVPDTSKDFHDYGVIWSPSYVAWYFDGRRVAETATPTDMDNPMYMIVELAVGGNWPGDPDDSTPFPALMQLKFVRAYAWP